jgi:hypothetical protein
MGVLCDLRRQDGGGGGRGQTYGAGLKKLDRAQKVKA